jgi:uncharacterized repeat protein (TIGR03803 family)
VVGGQLYGMTRYGGAQGAGVVFSIGTDGSGYTNYHDFGASPTDGTDPRNSLTLAGTTLYGMTQAGGDRGAGTIFAIETDGSSYRLIHSFVGADGSSPHGDVLPVGDNLFGMTRWGGAAGVGVVFRFNLPNGTNTVLHSFYGGEHDGSWPHYGILRDANTLYGQTYKGGPYGIGVVWRMADDGTGYTNLHTFNGADGSSGHGYLCLVGGKLCGLTPDGGTNSGGVAFSLSPDGQDFRVTHHFGQSPGDGKGPYGEFTLVSGMLFGMTSGGGSNSTGTIFRMSPDGTDYAVVHHFGGFDGAGPLGSLTLGADGRLYGMTSGGGSNNAGVVFSFYPSTIQLTIERTIQPTNTPAIELSWNSISGAVYQVQYEAELEPPNWQDLGPTVLGNGITNHFLDLDIGFPMKFYRVVLQ